MCDCSTGKQSNLPCDEEQPYSGGRPGRRRGRPTHWKHVLLRAPKPTLHRSGIVLSLCLKKKKKKRGLLKESGLKLVE
ncbi:hypothetical protein JOB18_007490 [Solea senegalensis]|uniref:Uncharacterized protein n=1 Tax=Solea senegalensis TaxID=28829 RepID=A0AAV6QMC9_SOLSE|nr:hypothetical protein JOB18_007490 [Solea senegalensis]